MAGYPLRRSHCLPIPHYLEPRPLLYCMATVGSTSLLAFSLTTRDYFVYMCFLSIITILVHIDVLMRNKHCELLQIIRLRIKRYYAYKTERLLSRASTKIPIHSLSHFLFSNKKISIPVYLIKQNFAYEIKTH